MLPQTGPDVEVIVVDDGSSDDTVGVCRGFGDKITLLHQPNQGPGPARNLGAQHAQSEWVAFLDSDDLWLPWTLRHLLSLLNGPNPPSLLASMPAAFTDEQDAHRLCDAPLAVEWFDDYLTSDPVNIVPGGNAMVVRRDLYLKAGGFASTRMGAEDAELFLRLGLAPRFAFVRSPALVAYRMHHQSFSLSIDAGLRGRWEMIRRERAGLFPGGPARACERRRIITSHCRSGTIVALRAGMVGPALSLYRASFLWNMYEGRVKYRAALPVLAVRAALRGATPASDQGFLPVAPPNAPASPPAPPAATARGAQIQAHPASTPRAAVVLATRNRKDELRRALLSCLAQTVPLRIVVRDDGSTDGTDAMVRAEFPGVDYARHDAPRGSIPNRNDAVAALRNLSGCEIVFSIDDDAAFPSPRTVEQTLAQFDHPRVGCVAIPFIDVLKGGAIEQAAPPGADPSVVHVLDTFRGCAAAWRRDLFLALGGYTPILRHMAEEPDLALRMLDSGFVVRAGAADPVHHFESLQRDWSKIWFQIARNGVLQGAMTAPWFMLPIHFAGTLLASLRVGLKRKNLPVMLRGALRGVVDSFAKDARRRPVSAQAYFLCRWLRTHKPADLRAIEHRLPPMRNPLG